MMSETELTSKLLHRLAKITKLYDGYSGTDQPVSLFGEEFFYTIGDIIWNDVELKDLELKYLLVHELIESAEQENQHA